jgi:hypothetical protein
MLRVEWERAGWQHAGDPAGESRAKLELLRWRLHMRLGELVDGPLHFSEACLLRPDLGLSQAAFDRILSVLNPEPKPRQSRKERREAGRRQRRAETAPATPATQRG